VIGRKSVELGLVEIREGLPVGAKVISVKQEGLKHGAKAIVKAPSATPVAPPAAAQPDTQNKKS
jgi:hypothetical protein